MRTIYADCRSSSYPLAASAAMATAKTTTRTPAANTAAPTSNNPAAVALESAKQRCHSLIQRIRALPPSRITHHSCYHTLLKLTAAELSFLSRASPPQTSHLSTNIGYLEAVVHVLQQPFVFGVSRVCKTVKGESFPRGVHVDVVCTIGGDPVWFLISDRNPRYLSWSASSRDRGLKVRVKEVVDAACSASTLMPAFVVCFFSNGVEEDVVGKLKDEFGAVVFDSEPSLFDFDVYEEVDEEDWVCLSDRCKFLYSSDDNCDIVRSSSSARAFQIKLANLNKSTFLLDNAIENLSVGDAKSELSVYGDSVSCANVVGSFGVVFNDGFSSIVSALRSELESVLNLRLKVLYGKALINFDTTALVAIVSGVSNDCAKRILDAPDNEIRSRYKGNTKFIIEQAVSELDNPILIDMRNVLCGKLGIICRSVHSEFMELVSTVGGPMEKERATQLLGSLLVVDDCPSQRMVELPTTRKIAMKNKIIFGTGDHWSAPTLTANMGFVRAISQMGMSLITVGHRPRALTGD